MEQRPSQADRQDRGRGAPGQQAHPPTRRSLDQEHPPVIAAATGNSTPPIQWPPAPGHR